MHNIAFENNYILYNNYNNDSFRVRNGPPRLQRSQGVNFNNSLRAAFSNKSVFAAFLHLQSGFVIF